MLGFMERLKLRIEHIVSAMTSSMRDHASIMTHAFYKKAAAQV